MKKISLLVAMIFMLASSGLVLAGPKNKASGKKSKWEMEESTLSKLDLTEEQRENIRVLRESFQKEITPLRSQAFEKKAEVRLLWKQIKLDPVKIKSLEREIHGLMGQLREKSTDYRLAFRNILTPEQASKFVALIGARDQHHRKSGDGQGGTK